MPIIKLSLTSDEYCILHNLANDERLTIQDLIRTKFFSKKNLLIFTPEEAVRRALEKYTPDDPPFTLPDIYGDEWLNLEPRMTGVFGKRFFNHVNTIDTINFVGMTSDRRRATYIITT